MEEIQELIDVLDDCELRCDNLMNEFEPGTIQYDTLSSCLNKLTEIIKEINKLKTIL